MEIVYHQYIMLGYVTVDKNELKVREYNVYQGYYCGICKSCGSRLGQISRMVLSYDAVFLAMVLGGLSEEADEMAEEHCIIHPIQKKTAVRGNAAVDYAADMMVILAYHKFLDDWRDERSVSGFAGRAALFSAYRKMNRTHSVLCAGVEEALGRLSKLEHACSGSIDETADAFAQITELLFTGYGPAAASGRVLAQLGRNLGRWIYLIDALDDYGKDIRDGSYNPLIYRKNGLEGIGDLLYNYLAEIAKSYDLLNLKKNREIIGNIIFMGLRQRTDLILLERTNQ